MQTMYRSWTDAVFCGIWSGSTFFAKISFTGSYARCFNALFEPRHDKTNKMSVRPAKTQISLGIRPVWSQSLLWAQWVAKDTSFLRADSEDSDQTGRMPRLIWVFAGRTLNLLVLSWGGSIFSWIRYCPSKHTALKQQSVLNKINFSSMSI